MSLHYIVMADIVKSRSYEGGRLLSTFDTIVNNCNAMHKSVMLSPYTITLGDEFQGVVKSLRSAIDTIFYFEEALLDINPLFQLRYVVVFGEIETEINPIIAHRMTGPGLAMAREMLTQKKRSMSRFQFNLQSINEDFQLNLLFRLLQSLISSWNSKDYKLVKEMIQTHDDKSVAQLFHKDRSQVWKRRKTLRIEDYIIVKKLIYNYVSILEGQA